MLRKIPGNGDAKKRLNTFPKLLTNAPAKGRDFGLAHTHGSVETTRASGPAPGRTLHTKSGSTGAEDSTRQNLYEDNTYRRRAVKWVPIRVVGPFEHGAFLMKLLSLFALDIANERRISLPGSRDSCQSPRGRPASLY